MDVLWNHQMESSVCQFDADLQLLRHEKLRLCWQLKLADLRQLTLYQELLLLKEFERRKDSLQEKLNGRIHEENSITVGESLRTCGPDLFTSLRSGSLLALILCRMRIT